MKSGSFIEDNGVRIEVGSQPTHMAPKTVSVNVGGSGSFDVAGWRDFVKKVDAAIEKEER